jgi:hypothetical protein
LALFRNVFEKELRSWITSPELQGRVQIDIQVYVTAGPTSPGDTDNDTPTPSSSSPVAKESSMFASHELPSKALNGESHVRIFYHRPDILQVITEAVAKHKSDGGAGRLAVVSCGPGRMADDARAAVVKMLGKGHGTLDFFPESFN